MVVLYPYLRRDLYEAIDFKSVGLTWMNNAVTAATSVPMLLAATGAAGRWGPTSVLPVVGAASKLSAQLSGHLRL